MMSTLSVPANLSPMHGKSSYTFHNTYEHRKLLYYLSCSSDNLVYSPGGTSILGGRGGLSPNFASEILVGAPNFASKNINDKYPKLCPLNFRYDPKIGTFSQLLRLVVTELPKFFLLVDELGRTLPQFCLQTWCKVQAPPTSLFGSTPLGVYSTNCKSFITGNLITMLRLLKNKTFSTASHRVSGIIQNVRKLQTLDCWKHCATSTLEEKWCQTELLEMTLEKDPVRRWAL